MTRTFTLLTCLLASLPAFHAADAEPLTGKRTVSVSVDLGRSVHVMRGGIGASWHAIGPTVFMATYEGDEMAMGGPRSEAPRSYPAQLPNAEKVLVGLNEGVDGFSRPNQCGAGQGHLERLPLNSVRTEQHVKPT